MPPLINLVGQRFGRLTVVSRDGLKSGKPAWECVCDCGTVKSYRASDLRLGQVLSCGCLRNERVREAIEIHGHDRRSGASSEYGIWTAMKARCNNPNNPDYQHYGGRGISVCASWQQDFRAFLSDMGRRPTGKTLDRIDVNGNYEPGNCRWATWPEQRRNTRAYIAKHGEQANA